MERSKIKDVNYQLVKRLEFLTVQSTLKAKYMGVDSLNDKERELYKSLMLKERDDELNDEI